MSRAEHTEYRLGIQGLPALLDAMVGGKMYGVHTTLPPARGPLIASSLAMAIRAGVPAVLVTNASPDRFLQRAAELGFGELGPAVADGRLAVFSLRESTAKNIFRHGTARFLAELDHHGVAPGALVVFDGADDLFTLPDPFVAAEQVRSYREWVIGRQVCGLLVFTLLSPTSQFAGTYQALLEHFDGSVRLEAGRDQMEWLAEFWISPTGVVASRALQADIDSHGLLTVSPQAPAAHHRGEVLPPAVDENDVYCLDATLADLARQSSGRWVFADNLLGLLHASRKAVAATVILAYTRDTDLRQLAQAAHTLRITLGKQVRIVVRELDASLRYQNELLLVNLGVNLVIHRAVPVGNLPLALASLKGQVFSRDVEVDFEAALASVTPTHAQGHLPPARFVREVEEIVERSKALSVPYVLLSMPIPAGTNPADCVARFSINRDGDLLTVAGRSLHLFLSACPQVNVQLALRRLAGDSFEADFPEPHFCVTEAETRAALARIAHHHDEAARPAATLTQAHA